MSNLTSDHGEILDDIFSDTNKLSKQNDIIPWNYKLPYTTFTMLAILIAINHNNSFTLSNFYEIYDGLIIFAVNQSNNLSNIYFILFIVGIVVITIIVLYGISVLFKKYQIIAARNRQLKVDIEVEKIQLTRLYESTNGPHWRDRTRY